MKDSEFSIYQDLDILLKKKDELPDDPYTTENTMLALDYDKTDVFNKLLALDISEYLETFIDNKDNNLPPFFAFGKIIRNRMYISRLRSEIR